MHDVGETRTLMHRLILSFSFRAVPDFLVDLQLSVSSEIVASAMYRNVERYMVEYVHKHTHHISSQDIFIPFNSLLFSGTNIRYDCGKVTIMASLFFVVVSSWHRSDTVSSWLH